jgi:hypothetical protein
MPFPLRSADDVFRSSTSEKTEETGKRVKEETTLWYSIILGIATDPIVGCSFEDKHAF